MRRLKRISGTILLGGGICLAIYGGIGAWVSDHVISTGDRDPAEGMSDLRREAADYIPQIGYSTQDWIYWVAFFGGMATGYLGFSLREKAALRPDDSSAPSTTKLGS